MTESTIQLRSLWVNYSWLGMDEGWPYAEKAGTLIYTMSHGAVIKLDADTCRKATEDELKSWTGPLSPAWAEYYRNENARHD